MAQTYKMVVRVNNGTEMGFPDGKIAIPVNDISEVTFEEIAEEVIASAVSQFNTPSLTQTITIRMPEEMIVVPMASALIRQVLLNLLDNACRHSGDSTEIEISLSADETNALFSVSDNGQGIPEKDLPMLFEYGTNKTAASEANRGFGMGLPTCKTIIQAHGGNLWAENNPDRGCCFRFTLPLE